MKRLWLNLFNQISVNELIRSKQKRIYSTISLKTTKYRLISLKAFKLGRISIPANVFYHPKSQIFFSSFKWYHKLATSQNHHPRTRKTQSLEPDVGRESTVQQVQGRGSLFLQEKGLRKREAGGRGPRQDRGGEGKFPSPTATWSRD